MRKECAGESDGAERDARSSASPPGQIRARRAVGGGLTTAVVAAAHGGRHDTPGSRGVSWLARLSRAA